MTVVDTSVVIDALSAGDAVRRVRDLLGDKRTAAAPDVLVFEVLATLRRDVRRGVVRLERAHAAVTDLGDLPISMFPSLPLRARAWELRDNFSAADALFLALAERLNEPLATKDGPFARAVRRHTAVETVELPIR